MKLLTIFFIFVIASLLGIVFAVSVLAFEDPCADGACDPSDPCADGACEPVVIDPCAGGSCEPDPCADGSCDVVIIDPCADGSCDEPDPCADGSCEPEQPPLIPNTPPEIIAFSVPVTADKNSVIAINVTAMDSDGNVTHIELWKDNVLFVSNLEEAKSCFKLDGTADNPCTRTFTARVPNAYSANYVFVARAFDNEGASATSTASGKTNHSPEPVCTPGSVRWGAIPESLQDSVSCSSGEAKTSCNSQGQWEFLYCLEEEPACVDTSWSPAPSTVCGGTSFTQTSNCGSTRIVTGTKSCPVTPPALACTSAAWSCTALSPLTCPVFGQQTRACTQIDFSCSNPNAVKPAETKSCTYVPPALPNNPPLINSFSVPATADAGSQVTVSVTATDPDGGVDRIEMLQNDGSTIITSQSCSGIVSCTRSFILQIPGTFSSVYTFVARAFDNLGASAAATASGTTNPEPAPVSAPAPTPEEALEDVKVSVPSENIFVSTLVPDTGCIAPGDESFLYSSLRNRGSRALKDVKITATVQELGIRAVSGPFTIGKGDSASRFLDFDIPLDADSGVYYMRVAVTSEKDSVVKYRMFEVSRAC